MKSARTPSIPKPPLQWLVSLALLATPAVTVGMAAARDGSALLACAAVAELLGAVLLVRHRAVWRPPASASLTILYLMAVGWLWLATSEPGDAFGRLARGGLLFVSVGLLIGHDLNRTGLEPRRQAMISARRLLSRTRWPHHAGAMAELPEVQALRLALRDDPAPAVELLADPRPEVRIAALLALESRPYWRDGEGEMVLATVEDAVETEVRAAGIRALRHVGDARIVADLTAYLGDRSPEVRVAALSSLLGTRRDRWPQVRDAIRDVLADPTSSLGDSDLSSYGRLSPLAVCDLANWASEPEPLAGRSARALVGHYRQELEYGDSPALPPELARQVTDSGTPAALRVDLAHLLRDLGYLTPDLLDRMTDIDQPGPLRLLAAELLLAWNPQNPDAIDVLRGLGRQSNRETALVIARLVPQVRPRPARHADPRDGQTRG